MARAVYLYGLEVGGQQEHACMRDRQRGDRGAWREIICVYVHTASKQNLHTPRPRTVGRPVRQREYPASLSTPPLLSSTSFLPFSLTRSLSSYLLFFHSIRLSKLPYSLTGLEEVGGGATSAVAPVAGT